MRQNNRNNVKQFKVKRGWKKKKKLKLLLQKIFGTT